MNEPSFFVFVASLCRGLLEIFLLTKIRDVSQIFPFLSFWCIWYFVVFYTASYIISFFSGKSKEELMKFFSKFFFIIVLPPIVDRFVFGRISPYYYERPEDIFKHFFSFFLGSERVGKALVLNVLGIHFFVFLYTFFVVLRASHKWNAVFIFKAFVRALLCFLSLYTVSSIYAVGGFLPLIFPVLPTLPTLAIPFYNSVHGFFFGLLLFILILFSGGPKSIFDFFKSSLLSNFHYIILLLCGYIFSGAGLWYLPTFLYICLSFLFFKNDPKIFFPLLSISMFSPYTLISFLLFSVLNSESFKDFFRDFLGSDKILGRIYNLRFLLVFFSGYVSGTVYVFFLYDWFFVVIFSGLALIIDNIFLSFVAFVPFLTSGKPEFIFASIPAYIITLMSGKYWHYSIFITTSLFYFFLKNIIGFL